MIRQIPNLQDHPQLIINTAHITEPYLPFSVRPTMDPERPSSKSSSINEGTSEMIRLGTVSCAIQLPV